MAPGSRPPRSRRLSGGAEGSPRTQRGEALTDLLSEVSRFGGLVDAHSAEIASRSGQTPPRWRILAAVASRPLTVPAIARRLGLTRQSVQRIAAELAEDGLVTVEENPDHARSPLFELSEPGAGVLSRMNGERAGWADEAGSSQTAPAMRQAARLCGSLGDRLEGMLHRRPRGGR